MTRLLRVAIDGATRVAVQSAGDPTVSILDPAHYPTIASAVAESDLERMLAMGTPAAGGSLRRLAPVDPDTRVFCVAQNYRAHAQEVSGTDAPAAPVLFLKPVSALVGPDEDIALSPVTSFLDYEAELAVVIGHGVTVAAATCLNDGSARDLQPAELGGKPIIDWFSGKSLDRSGAVGPWLQLIDRTDDVADVAITCRVNDEVVQSDRTSSMVHDVAALMAFIGARVALRPGDVIATGTPGGVGAARGVSLQPGDVVDVEIEGVGRLVNTVKATILAPIG